MAEEGKVHYTDRAFEQDADLAMAGDVMRGLVELITNCDDAYGAAPGTITVLYGSDDVGRPTLAVCDNGPGLLPGDMKRCFAVLGGKSSGFHEGEDVRGLFGRGAKDTAAFGRTVFRSIRDGQYSELELRRDGTFRLDDWAATDADRASLGVSADGSGLTATMYIEGGQPVPGFPELVRRLSNHVQLRSLTSKRQVTLKNVRPNAKRRSDVTRWDPPTGDVLFDGDVAIPTYSTTAHLMIKKLPAPAMESSNVYARHGIEIRGSKAIYQNSVFGYRGPEIKSIYGILECPMIDQLIRDYDSETNDVVANPFPILRRDRDGLATDHPFTVALTQAVLTVVGPIIETLKPSVDEVGGGENLKKDLRQASAVIAQLLEADLARIDDPSDVGGDRPTTQLPIRVIPPRLNMRCNASRTMTVLVQDDVIADPAALTVAVGDSATLTVGELSSFRPHATFEDTSIANFRIEAEALGRTTITVGDINRSVSASAEIRVTDEVDTTRDEPTELRWANTSMSVAAEKTRTVTIEAPVSAAPTGRLTCRINIEGDGIELHEKEVDLTINSEGWLAGKVRITGRKLDTTTRIVARTDSEEAIGSIRVTRPSGLAGLGLELEIVDKKSGEYRAIMIATDTGHLVRVHARHECLSDLIGAQKPDGSFQNEERREVRVVLAEIIASTIADWLVTREALKLPADYNDADAVLASRNKVANRYGLAVQRLLVHD